MRFKLPNIVYKQSTYGITSSIENYSDHNGVRTFTQYVFYIKRKGILKRWDLIKSTIPGLEGITFHDELYRWIKLDKSGITKKSRDYTKPLPYKVEKTGENVIEETVSVVLKIPFNGAVSRYDEMQHVCMIREYILAENSRITAQDKIDALMNRPTLPEYDEKALYELRYRNRDIYADNGGRLWNTSSLGNSVDGLWDIIDTSAATSAW